MGEVKRLLVIGNGLPCEMRNQVKHISLEMSARLARSRWIENVNSAEDSQDRQPRRG